MSLIWSEIIRQTALSLESSSRPPIENIPTSKLLSEYRPTEWPTWREVRQDYEDEHPVVMHNLRDDLPQKGMLTPVDAFRHEDGGWAIHNGHHRILAAEDVGMTHIPVRHWEDERDIPHTKRYWHPEKREHYGPDEDPDDEGQLRY